jgi:glycosyltransferase involved in cell wall biosynthesis
VPLVSVIMPSYNHQRFVQEAIQSVLNQTFGDIELIVIDDASKDNSADIIKSAAKKDDRIRAVFHTENKGIARTMNEGVEKAEGKFLAFLDSDDLWTGNKLEREIEVLARDESLMVWSEGLVVDVSGHSAGITFSRMHHASRRQKDGYLFEELLKGNYISTQSLVLKTKYVKEIGFDEELVYLNDYRMLLELSKIHRFCFIDEPLFKYRLHDGNTIFSNRDRWRRDEVGLYEKTLKQYGNDMNNRTKASLYCRMGLLSFRLNDIGDLRDYMLRAIVANPATTIRCLAESAITYLANRLRPSKRPVLVCPQ